MIKTFRPVDDQYSDMLALIKAGQYHNMKHIVHEALRAYGVPLAQFELGRKRSVYFPRKENAVISINWSEQELAALVDGNYSEMCHAALRAFLKRELP